MGKENRTLWGNEIKRVGRVGDAVITGLVTTSHSKLSLLGGTSKMMWMRIMALFCCAVMNLIAQPQSKADRLRIVESCPTDPNRCQPKIWSRLG